MSGNKIDSIIILSGGMGKRFKPLSNKNLVLFNGRPLLDHLISHYKNYTDNLIVITNEETHSETESIAKKYGAKAIVQKGQGQAGAVLSAKEFLKGETLIANGDDMYHAHLLEEITRKRNETDVDGLFVSVIQKTYMPGGYLQLEDGYITGVVEKPDPDKMPSQYYKLVVDFIKDIDQFIQVLSKTLSDRDDVYEVALTDYISSGKKFKNVIYKGDWATLKYSWHMLDAMSFFLKEIQPYIGENVEIDPTAKIIGDVYIDDGVKIYEYSKIVGPCYIGKNAIIGNYVLVSQSMIGEKSVMGGYTELTRSYIGDNVWTHRAYIGDSVVQGDANFAAGSVTANFRFDKSNVSCRLDGKKFDTGRNKLGVITGRNIQFGVNAATMPGVMLSSGSFIKPGEVCSRDM